MKLDKNPMSFFVFIEVLFMSKYMDVACYCWDLSFVTARKRSLRRLCFYTCLSFCSQGGSLGPDPGEEVGKSGQGGLGPDPGKVGGSGRECLGPGREGCPGPCPGGVHPNMH